MMLNYTAKHFGSRFGITADRNLVLAFLFNNLMILRNNNLKNDQALFQKNSSQ